MYIPQYMPFLQISHVYQVIDIYLFFASVEASTLTQYIFHVYLVVNPKRELDFKVVITVGLQDNITLETSYVFNLYVYYLRIKLTGFCKHRP